MMKLAVRSLACERNGRQLFSNLDFAIAPGDYVELRGPNGSGKSSLLRVLAGLLPASGGSISFGEKPMTDEDAHIPLHFIAHDAAMKAAMTVAENLQFWCEVLGGGEIIAALKAFSLEPLRDDPVQLLSAGQRRRLTLSRLFVANRPLWLLDEPATALDQASITTLHDHMRSHLRDGGMIVSAVHGETGLAPHHTIHLGREP